MKNSFSTRLLAIAIAAIGLVPVAAFAAELRAGEQPSVASGTTIQDDLYIAGGNVTQAGAVTGDVIAAGGSVLISGTTQGDLLVAGGNITILGDVSDDVRVVGGNITIHSKVASDVAFGGGQVTIAGAGVGGDVVGASGTVRIDAPVAGDVRIAGGDVYINSAIRGMVEVQAEKVTLGPGALISGDLTYTAGKEVTIEEGGKVNGKIEFKQLETTREELRGVAKTGIAALVSAWLIGKFLMLLVGAFAFFYLFKRYTETLVSDALTEPLPQLGRGVVAFIVWPIASVILLVTVIGIPLGAIGLLGYAAALIFAHLMASVVLGSLVSAWWTKNYYEVNWKTVLLGVVLYFILGYIPFVGWLICAALVLITLGAALKIKWGVAKEWR
ncbi:hypothetical protein HY969_01320 [Candidatus Kaiserbacteria bacterium]|nr:hypothetical protein [Candidatus Kaiserbacteria bacterium]